VGRRMGEVVDRRISRSEWGSTAWWELRIAARGAIGHCMAVIQGGALPRRVTKTGLAPTTKPDNVRPPSGVVPRQTGT